MCILRRVIWLLNSFSINTLVDSGITSFHCQITHLSNIGSRHQSCAITDVIHLIIAPQDRHLTMDVLLLALLVNVLLYSLQLPSSSVYILSDIPNNSLNSSLFLTAFKLLYLYSIFLP